MDGNTHIVAHGLQNYAFFPQYLCMERLNIHNRREKKGKKVKK